MKHKLAYCLSTALTAVSISSAALAQDARVGAAPEDSAVTAAGLEDIIVTARRKGESLQTVPVAITAVSGADLRSRSVTEMKDLQRVAPSLGITTTTRGGSTPIYAIRGQRASAPSVLFEPTVTLYFAEVGQSLPTGSNAALFDLESVQVLKGPQGTLFGRNTTGGAILITPEAPTQNLEGYVQGSIGNFDLGDVEGVINVPIGEEVAIRVGGKRVRRDGYLHDATTGQDADDVHTDSLRGSIRLNLSDAIQTTTIGTYFKNDSVGQGTKLDQYVPAAVPAALGAFKPAINEALSAALVRSQALGKYGFESTLPLSSYDKVWGVQNITTIDLGDVTLKNVAGYRDIYSRFIVDFDSSSVDLVNTAPGVVDAQQFSDEFQILGKTGKLDYIAGLFYYHQKAMDLATSTQLGVLAPLVPAVFPSINYQDFDARNTSYAAFVHANYDLGDLVRGLSVSAGFRYTVDKRGVTYHSRSTSGTNVNVVRCTLTGQAGLPAADRDACSVSESKTFKQPTYDASINYQASRDLLVYAAYRHGYRSGGFNTTPLTALVIPPSFDPEKVDDVEVGLKSDFEAGGMKGRLNVASFYSRYSKIQRNIFVPNSTGSIGAIIVNAAKAHIYGGEAELTLKPTSLLTLTASYALTKASYDKWIDRYLVGGVITEVDVSDSKFSNIPKSQFTASARLDVPMASSMGNAALTLSYYYQSRTETNEINTANCGPDGLYLNCLARLGAVPGYGLVNARAEWNDFMGSGMDVAAFVNNLTDKYYRADAINGLGSLGFRGINVGPPRMYGLEVRVAF